MPPISPFDKLGVRKSYFDVIVIDDTNIGGGRDVDVIAGVMEM